MPTYPHGQVKNGLAPGRVASAPGVVAKVVVAQATAFLAEQAAGRSRWWAQGFPR